MYAQRLEDILARIRANSSDNMAASLMIRLRMDITAALRGMAPDQLEAAFRGELGQVHGTLLSLGISGYPAQPFEQGDLAPVLYKLANSPEYPGDCNLLLAGMFYEGPHKLLSCEALPGIPAWLMDSTIKYALGVPWLFKGKGEIEAYYDHLSRWIDYLHDKILSNRNSAFWQEVLRGFMSHNACIPLYFSWRNPREIYRKRGELMEFALNLWGCRPGYEFGQRVPEAGRIRFGVLVPSFVPRSETFATLPVYSHLDREAIEIILLAPLSRGKSLLEDYCMSRADRLVELPDDLNQSVEAIRKLDLDVLWIGTNLSAGSSKLVNLGAHRLARVQITGGCSPTTTGLSSIDMFVSGSMTEPESGAQEQYTEKLVCVDGPVLCFDFGSAQAQQATRTFERSGYRMTEQTIVYASGTNFFKITPELEELWIRILASSPGSRLLLYPFNPNWIKSYPTGPFLYRISSTCKRLGVDGNRLEIIAPLPSIADVRAMLGSIVDVYLDSFPHSGMTSLIDPLLAGVPTVVLEGNSQRSRQASGALRDLGLTGLVAEDQAAYVELAVRLGQDREFRLDYADRIRRAMADKPKFLDSSWYGGEMNRLLKGMVNR
jgi:hypothetical protein